MTALLERTGEAAAASDMSLRLDVLAGLVRLGQDRLDEGLLEDSRAVLSRAEQRLHLSGEHTVIALAGATGSGKSSLFNAIAGIDLSPVGVRRPTTGATHACVWGLEGSRSLLEWLDVEKRHRYARRSALDSEAGSSLHGLVLLDLPDHDSTAQRHRLEVDRLVTVADLVVWVVDPQKYADAAVHERYLRHSSRHAAVTTVVLNQADVLAPGELQECLDDLQELLRSDGLPQPRVLATSARTGAGMEEFRQLIDETLADHRAAAEHLDADLEALVTRLEPYGSADPVAIDPARRRDLVTRLSEASGVTAAARAAEHEHRRRGERFSGWPLALIARAMHGDPLRRVRLGQDARDELQTAPAGPVTAQRAMVTSSVRNLGEMLTGRLPEPWRDVVERAGQSSSADLPDALGEALAAVPAEKRPPVWWPAAAALQWLLALYAFAGTVWMACILAFGYLGAAAGAGFAIPAMLRDTDLLPYAVLAVVEGLVAGLVVAWLAAKAIRRSARARSELVRAEAGERIGAVTDELILLPMQHEVDRYAEFHRTLLSARGVDREAAIAGQQDAAAAVRDSPPTAGRNSAPTAARDPATVGQQEATTAGEEKAATVERGKASTAGRE